MRVGLVGGSFDPIHNAHLAMGKWALRKDHCDEVWYIPSVQTPLKDRVLTSYEVRAKMVKAALRPYRHMKLCDIEQRLSAPSYTVRTLRELKKRYPDIEFIWYIGADQAAQLDKWKQIEECLQLAKFKIFRRNGEIIQCAYSLPILEMEEMPVSSTQIRQGAFELCPAAVRSIIADERLYIDEYVAHSMSEKRYQHSVSVAKLSAELAAAHGLDVDAAYTAGMLHDICKQWPYEKAKGWMQTLFPQYLEEAPAIWHGYLGAVYARRHYRLKNRRILNAIYHHVKGDCADPIARIIYMADKLDPLRDYDSSNEIALAKKDLKAAYEVVYAQQQDYLKKEKKV